jgi:hypothetical protein
MRAGLTFGRDSFGGSVSALGIEHVRIKLFAQA